MSQFQTHLSSLILLHYNYARLKDLRTWALPHPMQGYTVDLQLGLGKQMKLKWLKNLNHNSDQKNLSTYPQQWNTYSFFCIFSLLSKQQNGNYLYSVMFCTIKSALSIDCSQISYWYLAYKTIFPLGHCAEWKWCASLVKEGIFWLIF